MAHSTTLPAYDHVVHETPAPAYTGTVQDGLSARLEVFQKAHPDYPIVPVTEHPEARLPRDCLHSRPPGSHQLLNQPGADGEARALQADVAAALAAHISSGDTAEVTRLVGSGLVSPDCPGRDGETPLLASIRCRSTASARALLALGADPNLAGTTTAARPPPPPRRGGGGCCCRPAVRTPLMLAAETGQLAVVRMLAGEFGADDAAVGPRGETALRLAAAGGHRDVVAYLPARRDCRGAWRRLGRSREAAALRRAAGSAGRAVVVLAWHVPRFLVVDVPREAAGFAWRRRRRALRLLAEFIRDVPRLLAGLARWLWGRVRSLPRLARRAALWVCEAVPRACGILWEGLVSGLRRTGSAVIFAATRLASVVHSFLTAAVTLLRDITLRDVAHDVVVAVQSLFVKLPRTLWAVMCQSVAVAARAIEALLSNTDVRELLRFACRLLCIVPQIFWSVLQSSWACFGRALEELMTLINPKRVSSRAPQP